MLVVPFAIANNWAEHPDLCQPIAWRTASGEGYIIFEASFGNVGWRVRLNDFPDEPCHTLLIDGNEIIHFDDWPPFWKQPPLPKNTCESADENAA